MTKYFIINRWATRGIQEREAEIDTENPNRIFYRSPWGSFTILKPYWHLDKDEAITQAHILRAKKIESLKRKIIKLEKLDFNSFKQSDLKNRK